MQERSVFRPPKLKIILLLLPLFFILWFAGTAQSVQASSTPESGSSSPVDQWVKSQVNNLPKDKVESYWDQLMKDYGGFFPDGATPTLMDMLLPGDKGLSLKGVLSGLLGFMWHEVLYNGKLLVTIVMISVLSMILETLQTA
ncbi:stage III sporulation protein AE, partial [Paenibacillus odorifer]